MEIEHTVAALRNAARASRDAGERDPASGHDCQENLKPLRAALGELAEPLGGTVKELLRLIERKLRDELHHDPETAARLSRAVEAANEWTDELIAWLRPPSEQRE
ncbi:hypothetical protein SAMN04487904_106224 [Actinopolyspora lacussalsi subsp. righensis]|uniref:Excreted virulence factor EspC, type VII ESX diderm n=1 Tax=Actinopolyspora righensis TaxID=995060 RepID=A0A1I7ABA3_9ACTN|nr:hypothetical protein [Actinopolyspora righensis]SFT72201.1 hypothetical protein SAMN04487904_106224 [Actinopolyspora righensis]